ncbi:MAG TPA: hypothetical protein VH437_18615 [Terriglobales bacterium]|jgi:hypothetical protein
MSRPNFSFLGLLLLAVCASAQTPSKLTDEVKAKAAAQKQAERDREHRLQLEREREQRHQHERHELKDHRHDHDRDSHIHKVSEREHGRHHGRKTGWGDCDVPPGQAKKSGCHSHEHHPSGQHIKNVSKPVPAKRPTAEVHGHARVDGQVR